METIPKFIYATMSTLSMISKIIQQVEIEEYIPDYNDHFANT